jgi:hypothetical protein
MANENNGDSSSAEGRDSKRNALGLSERFINWAKGLSILVGGLIAMYGAFVRGEPDAELAYEKLAAELTALRDELHAAKAYAQGFLDGQLRHTPTIVPSVPAAGAEGAEDTAGSTSSKPEVVAPTADLGVSKMPDGHSDAAVRHHKPSPTSRARDSGMPAGASKVKRPVTTKARTKPALRASQGASSVQIKKYVHKHYQEWTPQQRAAATVVVGRAIRNGWEYTRFLGELTTALSRQVRAPLPKTLDDAKRQVQRQRKAVEAPEMAPGE